MQTVFRLIKSLFIIIYVFIYLLQIYSNNLKNLKSFYLHSYIPCIVSSVVFTLEFLSGTANTIDYEDVHTHLNK